MRGSGFSKIVKEFRNIKNMSTLRVILGDQLNTGISSIRDVNFESKKEHIFLYEGMDEFTHVKHHKKKIAFLMATRRHFADTLKNKKASVYYTKLEDSDNPQNITDALKLAINKIEPKVTKIVTTEASEWHMKEIINSWNTIFPNIEIIIKEPDHFLCSSVEFKKWESTRKTVTMEFFYRMMRKKYNILMENNKPIGGKWNYDAMNREKFKNSVEIPKLGLKKNEDEICKKVLKIVEVKFQKHFGNLEPFNFAVTREDALKALDLFIKERLYSYGRFQDAMVENEPFLFHSCLSMYINVSLLTPLECIQAAIDSYNLGKAPINSVEGFIRQIIGWREFIKGIYDLKMPEYRNENYLNATKPLPSFFWNNKESKMNCLKQCIKETEENSYAHHIQRLMVLGNFCLLAGIDPKEVNEWYWIVYADAFEWVELPNVSGMILYADGGYLASKPYAASGSYINRMSNYCGNCAYSPTIKTGPKACPFNYLYWDFLDRNKEVLSTNPRLGLSYGSLRKMNETKVKQIREDSKTFFEELY